MLVKLTSSCEKKNAIQSGVARHREEVKAKQKFAKSRRQK